MKATTIVLMLALLLAACAPVANQRPLTAAERVELQRQEELRRERYCRTNFVYYREAKEAEGGGSFWGGYTIGYYESQCAGITVFSTRD